MTNPFETNSILRQLLCLADRRATEQRLGSGSSAPECAAIRAAIAKQEEKIAKMEQRLQTLNDTNENLNTTVEASRKTLEQ